MGPAPVEDVRILDVTGLPSPFSVPPVSIPRHFKDSQSLRFGGQREVTPSEASVPRINPLAGEEFPTDSVNAGTYQAKTRILGFGFQYQL